MICRIAIFFKIIYPSIISLFLPFCWSYVKLFALVFTPKRLQALFIYDLSGANLMCWRLFPLGSSAKTMNDTKRFSNAQRRRSCAHSIIHFHLIYAGSLPFPIWGATRSHYSTCTQFYPCSCRLPIQRPGTDGNGTGIHFSRAVPKIWV